MDSIVIVALPAVDDKVTRISSEKVPHLTLCFLGEDLPADDLVEIVEFVQHAASQLSPFGMTVDHRGTLGPDDADVLFFEDNKWDLDRIKQFRAHLLQNDTIQRAYASADQYPEWTPHLTLGYPETPAKEDTSDYPGIHYVSFDRVAVWMGDSEGPTFRLKYEDHGMDVAMSDMTTAERGAAAVSELFHFGKKGMKWGVRNDKGHEGEQVKNSKLDKLDEKWEKGENSAKAFIEVHNAVADRMNNGEIDKFNADPRWTKAADDGHLMDDNHPETKAYFDAYESLTNKIWAEEVVSRGSNPSGTKAYELREDAEGNPYAYLAPVKADVQHAEGDVQPVLELHTDDRGVLTSVVSAEHELMHFGVKGMKWGVRNDKSSARSEPKPDRGKIRRAVTKANTALDAGAKVIDKGEKKLIFLPKEARQKAASETQSRVLGEARQINKQPAYKGKDLKRDPALKEAYFKEVEAAAVKIYKEELAVARVEVAANVIHSILSPNKDSVSITADSDRIQHIDDNQDVLVKLVFDVDDLGQVQDVGVPESFLAHYGVKGMKWGVTKVDKASSPTLEKEKAMKVAKSSNVTVTQKKAGHYAKASGGKRLKATDDAVKAVAARQKAKKSTTDALTNQELKAAVERMQLEQQYAKLDANTKRRGKGFIAHLFSNPEARARNADLLKRAAATNAA